MRLSVLLIALLALYLIPFGTQVYGSTDSTIQCDLPANQSCPQTSSTSQVKSETESETTQTPLIFPDLSPTREDLNNVQADESTNTVDSNDNDDAENNDGDNSDDEEINDGGSEENDEGSGDGPSMIPFP